MDFPAPDKTTTSKDRKDPPLPTLAAQDLLLTIQVAPDLKDPLQTTQALPAHRDHQHLIQAAPVPKVRPLRTPVAIVHKGRRRHTLAVLDHKALQPLIREARVHLLVTQALAAHKDPHHPTQGHKLRRVTLALVLEAPKVIRQGNPPVQASPLEAARVDSGLPMTTTLHNNLTESICLPEIEPSHCNEHKRNPN